MNDNKTKKNKLVFWNILSALLFLLVLILFYQNYQLKRNNNESIENNNQSVLPNISIPTEYSANPESMDASIPGDPIIYSQAKILTDQYADWRDSNSPLTKDRLEKSCYFYRQDMEQLFTILDSLSCDSAQQALRIYYGKYHDTLKITGSQVEHPYAGKLSLIVRAACLDSDISYQYNSSNTLIVNPSINFGEVCPPNCKPKAYDDRPDEALRKNGVNGPPNTSYGYFLE